MTGADECEIVSALADGVTSETIYFTIPDVSDGDIAGRDCAAAGLERRDYENGWCTFDVATSAATCNPRSDARSPILPTSTDIQKRCYLGVCQNPRCHEPMLLAFSRLLCTEPPASGSAELTADMGAAHRRGGSTPALHTFCESALFECLAQ